MSPSAWSGSNPAGTDASSRPLMSACTVLLLASRTVILASGSMSEPRNQEPDDNVARDFERLASVRDVRDTAVAVSNAVYRGASEGRRTASGTAADAASRAARPKAMMRLRRRVRRRRMERLSMAGTAA